MNKTLQKKLFSYSTLATALLAVEKPADGQIVYTPLNPPDTLGNYYGSGTYFLDLNNDGINDFEFDFGTGFTSTDNSGYNGTLSRWFYIKALGKNKVDVDTAENYNDSICDNKWKSNGFLALYDHKWHSFSSTRRSNRFFLGYFFSDTAKYLPLKLNVDSNTYYGWARITIDSDATTLLLSGYAYDSIPNECFTAGDTTDITTSIPFPSINQVILIWSYNKIITIKLGNDDLIGSTLDIYNTMGQLVYASIINASQTTIEMADLPVGIYITKLSGRQSTIVKKIALN